MTLTERDVARLESAGHADFCVQTGDGDLRLRNIEGRCLFLSGGACRAYAVRPEGCRLYPLILDLDDDRVVRDEFCPHRGEFPMDIQAARQLRRSVAREKSEASERRRRARG